MKKSQLNKIAKKYAVAIIINAMGTGADSNLLTENDLVYLQRRMQILSGRIYPNAHLGSLDEIIESVVPPSSITT